MSADTIQKHIFDTAPVGMVECGLGEGYPCRYINPRMLTMLGYASEEAFAKKTDGLCNNSIHPDDRDQFYTQAKRQLEEKGEYTLILRMLRQDGSTLWVDIRGSISPFDNGATAMLSTVFDVTEQKEIEGKYHESERRYRAAIEGAGINVWEYDIIRHRILYNAEANNPYQTPSVIDHVPESILYLAEDSPEQRKKMLSLFRRVEAGEPIVTDDFWMLNPRTGSHWWERVTYTTFFDEAGKPVKAYGTSTDVTQIKLADQRFHEETSLRDRISSSLLAACRINLTRMCVESMRIGDKTGLETQYREITDFRRRTLTFVAENYMSEEQNHRLSPEELLRAFNNGVSSITEEYLVRMENNRFHWLSSDVHLLKSPETGDVIAFFYNKDRTNEVIRNSVMDTVLRKDYEEVGIVNLRNGIYRKSAGGGSTMKGGAECDYTASIDLFCQRRVAAPDRERMRTVLDLLFIRERLISHDFYTVRFLGLNSAGEPRHTEMRFQYLNEDSNVILVTRTDINDIVKNEQEKQRALQAAVEAAKRADASKTEFLARMSHDMRTPMNTIIGLAALGMDELTDSRAQYYLSNINQSAHFLLGLINDVLDMSKVESGAVVLRPEPYTIQDFRNQILTMFQPLCEAKQITFRFIEPEHPAAYLMADKLRFNQIFFNLLSNAVKYTPAGGEVDFSIQYLAFHGNRILRRFTVRDNGYGMSEEFQKELFTPFCRERTEQTKSIEGTGLGLAITKHMIDLMHGSISVKSAPGKGSEFTVELELESSMTAPSASGHGQGSTEQSNFSVLAGRHVLLCEDHPLNAQIETKVLNKVGIQVDWADNGKTGLERFACSSPGFYDAILMDIRMPVMDGLDTARAIRELSRADAKAVPILAMTANAYTEDEQKSREAGMNAHLSKPVEPRELYKTLSALMQRKEMHE